MKKVLVLTCVILLSVQMSVAQTNTFPSSGNVGIGTTSPVGKLMVIGGTAAFPTTSGTTPATSLALRLRDNTNGVLDFGNNGASAWLQSTDASDLSQKYALLLNPNGGNIGIGTTSPVGKLMVISGASAYPPTSGTTPATSLALRLRDNTNGVLDFGNNGANAWLQSTDATDLSQKYPLLLNPNGGNIGIGTTSPTERLSVDGNAYINGNISSNGVVTTKKLTVTQTGWSDYVFDNDYKLRSLSSLESYLKRNKHLPEIPSAKEVDEKGISVGDNQALLLKKIEELTLYVIDQQKQIKRQNQKIKKLEHKITEK